MPRGEQHGHRRTLVVGAGLTGAALGCIARRAGRSTFVVSADRPASQATALASGAVHGVGPPGERNLWTRLPVAAHEAAAVRARRGFELLQEVLLAAPRRVGYTRLPHELHAAAPADGEWLEQAARILSGAGWPLRVEERDDGVVLVREQDALVNPRRLTFELLHRARALGATVRLGVAYRGVERETPEGLVVRLFNPTDEAIVETIECPQPIRGAQRIDLEGRQLEVLKPSGGSVRTSLATKQIVTLRLS